MIKSRFAVWFALCVCLILAPRCARAQGTSGVLPTPINSQELQVYARMLQLSPEQLIALDTIHADYRRDFRLLREGQINKFLADQREMQGGIPRRDRVEATLDDMNDILERIEALDRTLFERLAQVLVEDQYVALPRIRLRRERVRYDARQTAASFGRATVDLSELVRRLDLEADVTQRIDDTLQGYERRLTSKMKTKGEALDTLTLDLMDALAEAGFVEMDQETLMQDPELLRSVMTAVQEAYTALNANVAELNAEILKLNRTTIVALSGAMPPAEARALRHAWHRAAHSEIARIVDVADQTWVEPDASWLDEATADERATIVAASSAIDTALRTMLQEGGKAVDEFWETFSPFAQDPEKVQAYREQLQSLIRRAADLAESFEDDLKAQLGDARFDELKQHAIAAGAAEQEAAAVAAAGGGAEPTFRYSGDRFLPQALSGRAFRELTAVLAGDAAGRAVLRDAHATYVEAWRELASFDRMRDLRREFNGFEESASGDDVLADARACLDRIDDARRVAFDDALALDATLFDALSALVSDDGQPVLQRARERRMRAVYLGSAGGGGFLGVDQTAEASVDLDEVLFATELPIRDDQVLEILDTYHAERLTALQSRQRAQIEVQRLTDLWTIEVQRAYAEDIAEVVELQNAYRARMQDASDRAQATAQRLTEINQHALERVGGWLNEKERRTVRQAYLERAYPTIYRDPSAVGDQLRAALRLETLDQAQLDQLTELAASYWPEYDALTQQMVDSIGPGVVSVVGMEPARYAEWQEYQQTMARVRFDRSELNAGAIRRMKLILRDEQIAAIGGLPAPDGQADEFFLR